VTYCRCSCCGQTIDTATTITTSSSDIDRLRLEFERSTYVAPPRDGRWRQHYMAYWAFVWPDPCADVDPEPRRCMAPPVRRFGREGLGVRNWRRL
jgi:hypothetical protein